MSPPPERTPAGETPAQPKRGPTLEVGQVLSLHERLVARDEHALAELIEVAAPWLLAVSQAMLSDADEAEDVVQEAFTIVWNRIGQVSEDPRGLIAWLLRIARNRAIDRLRGRKRRMGKVAHLLAHGPDADQVAQAEEPNEAATPGWHVHRSVHAALQALPPEQLIAVQLAYFQGLTHSELAERLGIPIGTVKTRLRLAFDKLRPALAPIKDWIV